MARRHRSRPGGSDRQTPRPLGGVAGPESHEERAGLRWSVRSIPGQSARSAYVCPFCQGTIPPGTPHLVVFPLDEVNGLDQRRHWHTRCWGRYR